MTFKKATDRFSGSSLVIATLLAVASCSDSSGPGQEPVDLAFSQSTLSLGEDRLASILLQNDGVLSVGPITIAAGPVMGSSGSELADALLQVVPTQFLTLAGGSTVTIALSVILPAGAAAGDYEVSLGASVDGETASSLAVSFTVAALPPLGDAASIAITGSAAPRQGDVDVYAATVLDASGDTVTDTTLTWSVVPGSAGLIADDGRFVGYSPGPAQIIVSTSGVADSFDIAIAARNGLSGLFTLAGQGAVSDRFTSDLWAHGNFVYTGTWGCRTNCGDQMLVWDVSNPASPSNVGSVTVAATTINDVKVRADGQIAVITHEGSGGGGITILDLSNPASPSVITRFTNGLSGVHNVWVEGDHVYVAVDGSGVGLRIVDISNPSNPFIVASNFVGSSFLHDVYVRDGLAFLSQWNDGLVILDVGHGIAGGSPSNPIEVGRVVTAGGQTHNAWYWPAAGYVFVGEEDFGSPGLMHVVDARNLSNPVEVATFRVPGSTPHNFWLDETRGILYMAWYTEGV
ncbi:MAG: hypothetical protein Q8W48_05360, partial [Candidatus Palauibacterales bacterium]|nr:hypothetical protein [Candidatus Palauibacterales bacterium]